MSEKTQARPGSKALHAGLSPDEHQRLYANLKKTRLFDERCRKLFKAGRLPGTYFSQVGQEAIGVGSCTFLRHEDWVAPAHRNLSAHISKGAPLRDLLAQVYAKAPSPDRGKSHPCHWGYPKENSLIIASTIAAHAVVGSGIALAFQLRKQDHVVVSFIGEGTSANGAYHEALNFAAIRKLPIVFTIENNLWAESVPTHLSAAVEHFSDRGKGHGVPGVTIDGNDVLTVYDTFHAAIEKARTGGGPTLIEALTYRWYGHSEIDPANYRSKEEVARWKAQDPVPRYEKYLTSEGILSAADLAKIEKSINDEIEDAIEYAEAAPKPRPEEALEDVYSFSPNHDRPGRA
jgi:TPP-dependent pyruvate/acetoin dehydrogenase alpha subunit